MSDFIDRHAEESSGDDSDAKSAKSHSTGDSTDSDDEPVVKKVKKEKEQKKRKGSRSGGSKKDKKKRKIESSDEEEDDDEDEDEQAKLEMKGFIVDQDDDAEGGEDNASEKSAKSDLEEDLDEDDLDLIEENLDVKGQLKKHKRVAHIDDSDEEPVDDRTAIGQDLFGMGLDDDEPPSSRREPVPEERSDDEGSESDGSRADDFIEYDKDERRGVRERHKKRKENNFAEGALDEARDIFGTEDFNYQDFYDEGEDVEAEDDEMYDDDELMDGDDQPRARRVKKHDSKKETLLDTMEPTELDRGYLAPADKKIQLEDRPERFQLRRVPVTEATEEELVVEASWIWNMAFQTKTLLSKQEPLELPCLNIDNFSDDEEDKVANPQTAFQKRAKVEQSVPEKIREALKFMRNSNFEVPFIGFYRKENLSDVLAINELWRVYKWDQKWCHLSSRKNKLLGLYRRMQNYLEETGEQHHRPISDTDQYDVEAVATYESLNDAQAHFHLYYASDLARMAEWEIARKREAAEEAGEEDPELPEISTKFKQATRKDKYQMCVEFGIGEMAAKFGLTARQFAENLDWKRHDVEQAQVDPHVAAEDYVSTSFPSVDDVINGSIFMLAKQISREPAVRARIRDTFRIRATVSVRPTQKGRETLDESHPVWKKRYIAEKPIKELEGDDYLYYSLLKDQGLLEVTLNADKKYEMESDRGLVKTLIEDQVFYKDEYNQLAEAWNNLRTKVVEMAIGEMLLPELKQELHARLLEEAKEFVIKRCSEAMYSRLLHSSYKPQKNDRDEDDDDDDDDKDEVLVLGLVYALDRDEVSFGALVDQDGVIVDTIRLPYLMNRRGQALEERQKREDMQKFGRFLERHRPHVVAIAGENLQARFVKNDVSDLVMQLYKDNQITRNIQVVIHDNDAAKVYMQSKQAEIEHPDFPSNLRQALSLARCLLDPLVEYAHLYNADEDIFCLSLHPLQSDVNKEDLQEAISLELINRVNEVGVDINKCAEHSHQSGLLQFVCGLGPRKAAYLLKIIRQNNCLLESRTRLVTLCKIGPKVFMNCAGFIRIDTVRVSERTDIYVEVLDGSRVHPETYEWARKMAVDALEVDDAADPTAALEEVLQTPDRLKDLDLDAFADELYRQGFGNKGLTLYDIRSELFCRYKDLRQEYTEPTETQLFGMLTKETMLTLFIGKLVQGKVERVVYRKYNDRDKQPEPIRDDDMWKCSQCYRKYHDVADIFAHYESTDPAVACPGTPIGIKVRLDNGIQGFIHNKALSDNPSFRNPCERVKLNQSIFCRVTKVEPERFSCDLTSRSSELRKTADEWLEKDQHWDDDAQKEDQNRDDDAAEKLKMASTTQFVKRVISHPHFHNVTYKDAERMLTQMDQGDAIIRPSSKSANNLTVTWKVADGIYCHVDVLEQEKEKPFTLGKKLIILADEFEDLEEILSRYIQPMASYCREVLNHKYALEGQTSEKKDEIEVHLQDERRANPSKIPYCFTPSTHYPGKFTLNYLMRKLKQEYFTPQPEGLRFRGQMFPSIESMLTWFKAHYRDRPPMSHYSR